MGAPGSPGRRKYAWREWARRSSETVRPHGDQRLGRHLSAEDAGYDGGLGLAAEDVLLDLLKVEQIEETLKCLAHGTFSTGR